MQLFSGVCSGELTIPEAKQALESMNPGKELKDIMKKMARKFFKNAFDFGNTQGAPE